jgi:hypothetical protein
MVGIGSKCASRPRTNMTPRYFSGRVLPLRIATRFLRLRCGRCADRARAMAELKELKEQSHGKVLPFNLALVYLGMGASTRWTTSNRLMPSTPNDGAAQTGPGLRYSPFRTALRCADEEAEIQQLNLGRVSL